MKRPSASVVAPSGNADQLRLSRFSVPRPFSSGLPSGSMPEDLDLRPGNGFAPGLDHPAADDPFWPELERIGVRRFCGVSWTQASPWP